MPGPPSMLLPAGPPPEELKRQYRFPDVMRTLVFEFLDRDIQFDALPYSPSCYSARLWHPLPLNS